MLLPDLVRCGAGVAEGAAVLAVGDQLTALAQQVDDFAVDDAGEPVLEPALFLVVLERADPPGGHFQALVVDILGVLAR